MTLLTIIQDVCNSVNIEAPTSVIGNTDDNVMQLLQLSQLEGNATADEYDWDVLQTQATFTTLANEIQGTVAALAPGFKKFINETQWNRTVRYNMDPMTAQDYQALVAQGYVTPYPEYRIRGNNFIIYPAPAAGQLIAFEFITKNWILDPDGVTTKARWSNDSDTAQIDEDIITLGTIWRYLKVHGFDYAEEFRQHQIRVANVSGRDGGKPRKFLDSDRGHPGPFYPNLPEGNWNL